MEPSAEFSAVYEQYAAHVFRFALYLSGNRPDAEDITSETFVRAWTAPGRIEMATVKGYLFTIARNLYLRGRERQSRYAPFSGELRDAAPSALQQVEGQAELGAVVARLQELPEVDRAALLMRALDDMPYQEIARVLNVSVVAAKVKVHRARAVLLKIRSSPPALPASKKEIE